MKTAILALTALAAVAYAQPSFAGFRFNHVIYDCALDEQAPAGAVTDLKASIYDATPEGTDMKQDLAGQWLVFGTIYAGGGQSSFMGDSTVSQSWLNPDVVSIKERPEILGEEPKSISLSLNLRTLKGEVTYKRWNGYAPIGSADVKLTAPIACKKADRYIN